MRALMAEANFEWSLDAQDVGHVFHFFCKNESKSTGLKDGREEKKKMLLGTRGVTVAVAVAVASNPTFLPSHLPSPSLGLFALQSKFYGDRIFLFRGACTRT